MNKKFDINIKSLVIKGDPVKNNVALQGNLSPNPNQMNRLKGYLPDGTLAYIAQRPGKGGMEFNKLLSGKVFAVAADAITPVYEKDKEGNKTDKIKTEDGLPVYSSSGFYLLSSKEYPALSIFNCVSKLLDKGESAICVTAHQLKSNYRLKLESSIEFDIFLKQMEDMLSPEYNACSEFVENTNKLRQRGIQREKEECEDQNAKYAGVEYSPLTLSKKDGNPALVLSYETKDGKLVEDLVLMQATITDENYDDGRLVTKYFTPSEAVAFYLESFAGQKFLKEIEAQEALDACLIPANVFRTSVSFRKKVSNFYNSSKTQALYGDAVFLDKAFKEWTKSIANVIYSKHPNFPSVDYDSLHYVVALRQSELGMNRLTKGSETERATYSPPEAVSIEYLRPLVIK